MFRPFLFLKGLSEGKKIDIYLSGFNKTHLFTGVVWYVAHQECRARKWKFIIN